MTLCDKLKVLDSIGQLFLMNSRFFMVNVQFHVVNGKSARCLL